jgi:AraC-like DNA-binding protein
LYTLALERLMAMFASITFKRWGRFTTSVVPFYLLTTLSVAVLACLLIGFLLFRGALSALESLHRVQIMEKLDVVAGNVVEQRQTMQDVALQISIQSPYKKRLLDRSAFYEIDLLDNFVKYQGSVPISNDYFLIYRDGRRLYRSNGYTNSASFFIDSMGILEDASTLLSELWRVDSFRILYVTMPHGLTPLFTFPVSTMGRNDNSGMASLAFILDKRAFQEQIRLLAGELDGAISLYYNDRYVWTIQGGESDFPQTLDGARGWRSLPGGVVRYTGVSDDGSFAIHYDEPIGASRRYTRGARLIDTAYLVLAGLFVTLTAAAVGYWHYQPLRKISRKIPNSYSTGFASDQTEVEQIERFIERVMSEKETAQRDLDQRYRLIKRQALQLTLAGDESCHQLLHAPFWGIRLMGPHYLLAVVIPSAPLTAAKEASLADSFEELSENDMNFYFSPALAANHYAIIVNLPDGGLPDEAVELIRSLLQEEIQEAAYSIAVSPALCGLNQIRPSYDAAAARLSADHPASNASVPAHSETHPTASSRSKLLRAERLVEYLNEHYANPDMSLDLLSERFHITNRYISDMIREATGRSYKDYLTDLRVRKACGILSGESLSVTETCARVGYMHLPNFIRTFKRVTGETPSQYASSHGTITPPAKPS